MPGTASRTERVRVEGGPVALGVQASRVAVDPDHVVGARREDGGGAAARRVAGIGRHGGRGRDRRNGRMYLMTLILLGNIRTRE